MKRIVIVGPESTGKSVLAAQLAQWLQTLWCPEHARAFLHKNGMKYNMDTLYTIGAGQEQLLQLYTDAVAGKRKLEKKIDDCLYTADGTAVQRPDLLVADTDALVMQVWQEYVFGKCHVATLETIAAPQTDHFYLLTKPDLPWSYDPLREYPDGDDRDKLFAQYHALLVANHANFGIVYGQGAERWNCARQCVGNWGFAG